MTYRLFLSWLLAAYLPFALSSAPLPPDSGSNGPTIDAGMDGQLCAGGAAVALNGSIQGDFLTATWTSDVPIANPGDLSTTANVTATTTFYLNVTAIADTNLIVNGDFSLGDQDFTSDYIYGTGGGVGLLSNEGQYAIVDNAGDTHNQFANCSDNTGGGNMMVVNGSGVANNVWCQLVNIDPDGEYAFSTAVTSVVSQNPARLQFSIDGVTIGNEFVASPSTCNWQTFTSQWQATGQTSVEICVTNVNFDPAGNDFAIDDIAFQPICTFTDSVTFTVANLNADWTLPGLCETSPAISLNELLDPGADSDGTWTLDGLSLVTLDPAALGAGTYNLAYNLDDGTCQLNNEQALTIQSFSSAGTPTGPLSVCSSETSPLSLIGNLNGADTGGQWTEVSTNPSTGSAFNPNAGTFNPAGQASGTYTFTYNQTNGGFCPDLSTITLTINEDPIVDAGSDVNLDCDITVATLGGNSSSGPGISYQWSTNTGSILPDNGSTIEVSEAATYVLLVTNTQTGCTAQDEVTVTTANTAFQVDFSNTDESCAGAQDGQIEVTAVNGGLDPYLYSINGGVASTDSLFSGLNPGNYQLTIQDANQCDTTISVSIDAAPEIAVIINSIGQQNQTLFPGDSIQLRVSSNIPETAIDSVIWSPAPGTACPSPCLETFVHLLQSTTYQATLIDENGCSGTGEISIALSDQYRVYVPSAFSPNDDGVNDYFFVQAGREVAQVVSFRVFDRWGGIRFEQTAFSPNINTLGWDGKSKGNLSPTGAYVFAIELEMINGDKQTFQGIVNLLR